MESRKIKEIVGGSGAFTVIRAHDPAIDRDEIDQETWSRFIESRDIALLDNRWIPGERPALFHCRRLTLSERRDVAAKPEHLQLERMFQIGVQVIEGYPGLERWEKKPGAVGKVVIVPDRVLEVIAEEDVRHVGQVVGAFSFSAADRQPYVQLQGTCQAALVAAALRYRRHRAAPMNDSSSSGDGNARPAAASLAPSSPSSE